MVGSPGLLVGSPGRVSGSPSGSPSGSSSGSPGRLSGSPGRLSGRPGRRVSASSPLLGSQNPSRDPAYHHDAKPPCCMCLPCCKPKVGSYLDFLESETSPKLEPIQLIRVISAQKYDHASHQQRLMELWKLTFPSEPFPGPPSEHWKRIGFQGCDPATDFRAAGLFGLDSIIRFAKRHNESFQDIIQHSYPFAACALNVHRVLACHLHLTAEQQRGSKVICPCCAIAVNDPPQISREDLRTFCWLLNEKQSNWTAEHSRAEQAFQELFDLALVAMDELWMQELELNSALDEATMGQSHIEGAFEFKLLNFNQTVLRSTWLQMEELLMKSPQSIAALKQEFINSRESLRTSSRPSRNSTRQSGQKPYQRGSAAIPSARSSALGSAEALASSSRNSAALLASGDRASNAPLTSHDKLDSN